MTINLALDCDAPKSARQRRVVQLPGRVDIMIPKPLNEIIWQDVQILVKEKVRESDTIEYKSQLPGNADSEKIKFLAAVSSFANSVGGDLIFGIEEEAGLPISIMGIVILDLDQEVARLEQLIRDGIEERLSGVQIRAVPIEGNENLYVLIIRISKSWNGPHRVCLRDHAKFYARSLIGRYPMNLSQLRVAFSPRHLPYYARDLSTKALDIFMNKPRAWEYRLFAQVLEDEIAQYASYKRDFASGLVWGDFLDLREPQTFFDWISKHLKEAETFAANLSKLMNEGLPVAFGEPGVPGDAAAIVDIAKKIGEIYRRTIEWAMKLRSIHIDAQFKKASELSEKLVHDMVFQIEEFTRQLSRELQQCVEENFSVPKKIHLKLVLDIPQGIAKDLASEIKSLTTKKGFWGIF